MSHARLRGTYLMTGRIIGLLKCSFLLALTLAACLPGRLEGADEDPSTVASRLEEKGDYRGATAIYREMIRAEATPSLYVSLIRVLGKTRDFSQQVAACLEYFNRYPDKKDYRSLMWLVEAYANAGQKDKALQIMDSDFDMRNAGPDDNRSYGLSFAQSGIYDLAVEFYERSLRQETNAFTISEDVTSLVQLHLERKDRGKADQILDRYVSNISLIDRDSMRPLVAFYVKLMQSQGRLDKLMADLQREIDSGSTNAVTWEKMAQCHLEKQDKKKALACYRKSMGLHPAEAYLRGIINCLDDKMDYEDKARAYRELVKYPNSDCHYSGLHALVELHRANGALDKALDAAVELAREYPRREVLVGDILADQKKYAAAIECYKRCILAVDDKYCIPEYQDKIAGMLLLMEKPNEAKSYIEGLGEQATGRPIYMEALKRSYGQDRVLEMIEAQVKTSPNATNILRLIDLYAEQKNDRKVLELYKRLVKLAPTQENYHMLLNVSERLEKGGQAAVLEDMFEKLPELQSVCIYVRMYVAACYQAGETNKAIDAAEKCVLLNPKDPANNELASDCYLRAGRYDDALMYARHAVELSREQDNGFYSYRLGCVLLEMKKYDEVDKVIEGMMSNRTDLVRSSGCYLIVWNHRPKGDLPEYLAGLKAKADKTANDPYFREIVAGVCEAAGNIDEALTHYEKALSIRPSRDIYARMIDIAVRAEKTEALADIRKRYKRDFPDSATNN